jgi:hypothetical protein
METKKNYLLKYFKTIKQVFTISITCGIAITCTAPIGMPRKNIKNTYEI